MENTQPIAGDPLVQTLLPLTMPACFAYNACMERKTAQYTIRKVPAELDRRLRKLARQHGKSLNRVNPISS